MRIKFMYLTLLGLMMGQLRGIEIISVGAVGSVVYMIKLITGTELVNAHGGAAVSDPNAGSVAELGDSTLNTMPYLKPILSKLTELAGDYPAITHKVLKFKKMTQDVWKKSEYAKLATNSATTVTEMLTE